MKTQTLTQIKKASRKQVMGLSLTPRVKQSKKLYKRKQKYGAFA